MKDDISTGSFVSILGIVIMMITGIAAVFVKLSNPTPDITLALMLFAFAGVMIALFGISLMIDKK